MTADGDVGAVEIYIFTFISRYLVFSCLQQKVRLLLKLIFLASVTCVGTSCLVQTFLPKMWFWIHLFVRHKDTLKLILTDADDKCFTALSYFLRQWNQTLHCVRFLSFSVYQWLPVKKETVIYISSVVWKSFQFPLSAADGDSVQHVWINLLKERNINSAFILTQFSLSGYSSVQGWYLLLLYTF